MLGNARRGHRGGRGVRCGRDLLRRRGARARPARCAGWSGTWRAPARPGRGGAQRHRRSRANGSGSGRSAACRSCTSIPRLRSTPPVGPSGSSTSSARYPADASSPRCSSSSRCAIKRTTAVRCSSARPGSAATAAVQLPEVPDAWSPTPSRSCSSCTPSRGTSEGLFKMKDDPRVTARPLAAPLLAGRAAPAHQRPARRDEPRRPAAAAAAGGGPVRRRHAPPASGASRHDRPLAGVRPLRPAWSEAIRLDLYYVDNWSMMQDLSILGKTVGAVVGSRGAY